MGDNPLGEYLRAHREALHPADVGLGDDGRRRRVTGLRREEVAALAGISAEYYLRLEQGRERHPSEQVISAIARAMRLGSAAEEFLQRLVRPLPERGYPTATDDAASARLAALVASIPTPAFAHDRSLDVVAANPLARALSRAFEPEVNLLRAVFTDPTVASLYRNWPDLAERLVAYLRAYGAVSSDDTRLSELIAEVDEGNPQFGEIWRRQDVDAVASGVDVLVHPVAGEFELAFERLCFTGTDHPVIVIYHASAGSPSARALERLAATIP